MEVSERITTLKRVFNVERGLEPEDDYGDTGQRLLDPIPEGDKFFGVSLEPFIQELVKEYYTKMGWDVNTGRHYCSTLEQLELDEFAGRI